MGQKPAGPPPPIRTRPRCGPHGSGAGPAARRPLARRRFGNAEPGGPPRIPHLGCDHPVRRPAPRRARLRKPLPGRPGAIRRQPSGSAVPETGIGRTVRRCAEDRTAPSRGRSGAPDHPPRLPGAFPGPCPGPAAKSGPNAKRVPKRRRRDPPASQPNPAWGVVTTDPLRSAKPQPASGSVSFRTRECQETGNHAKIPFRTMHVRFLPHGVFCGAGSRESSVRLIPTGGEHKPHATSVRKSHVLQAECADSSIFFATDRSPGRQPPTPHRAS